MNSILTTRMWALLSPALLACLVACGSSTDPGGDDGGVVFSYSPSGSQMVIEAGTSRDFAVSASGGGALTAEWKLNGLTVSQTATYRYTAGSVGVDLLQVTASSGGRSGAFEWTVTVSEDVATLPPAVPQVRVTHGILPAEARVSWNFVGSSTYPIDSYLVACSFDGPLSVANWDQALQLGEVAHTGNIGYSALFQTDDGMIPGATAWFGVRARDELGQLSPLPQSVQHVLSYAWDLTGTVRDDFGRPMSNVLVKFLVGNRVLNDLTAPDGTFGYGPFSSVDSVQVQATATVGDYYRYSSPHLKAASGSVYDVVLIGIIPVDPACDGTDGDFLQYLRFMTMTSPLSEQTKLHKWQEYPVAVHIPDYVRSPDGLDFAAASREALDLWNSDSGLLLFEEVASPGAADIIFNFDFDEPALNGQAVLVSPQGFLNGAVTPELVRVDINNVLPAAGSSGYLGVKGVALHELGHTLGLYAHSSGCSDYRLMDIGAGSSAFSDGRTHPVHQDEMNAVRCIRYLNQAVDLSRYDSDGRGAGSPR
ncbi:MAG: matrixin family metalloprotease [bacterium]